MQVINHYLGSDKIKAVPVHAMGVGGSTGITPIIINLDTRRSGQFHAPAALPQEKNSRLLIK